MARLRGGFGRALIGFVVSIAALVFIVRQVDLARTAEILGRASLGWIALMLLFQALDVLLRAFRWQRLVEPIHHVRFLPITGYLLIGYLANGLMPLTWFLALITTCAALARSPLRARRSDGP